MVRHESAEALGALGDEESLSLLRQRRDDAEEAKVVKETCEIAVERIEWETSEARKAERIRTRYVRTAYNLIGPEILPLASPVLSFVSIATFRP